MQPIIEDPELCGRLWTPDELNGLAERLRQVATSLDKLGALPYDVPLDSVMALARSVEGYAKGEPYRSEHENLADCADDLCDELTDLENRRKEAYIVNYLDYFGNRSEWKTQATSADDALAQARAYFPRVYNILRARKAT